MSAKRIRPKIKPFVDLSWNAYNVVVGSGIETIDQLAERYPDDKDEFGILRVNRAGPKTVKELTEFLEKRGKTWNKRKK